MSLSPSPPPQSVHDIVFKKRDVSTYTISEVEERIALLSKFRPLPSADDYIRVEVTPLRVVLVCKPPGPSKGPNHGKPSVPLPRGLSEIDARPILRGVLRCLYALHRRRCACGSLSPSSFTWDEERGAAWMTRHVLPPTFFVPGSEAHQQSRTSIAPEIAAGVPYGSPADVWTFGVVMLHLLSRVEYETEDLVDTSVVSPAINHLSPVAVSLLIQCLKADPTHRPTLMDLTMHPYLMGLDGDLSSSSDEDDSAEESQSDEEEEDEADEDDSSSDED